MAEPKHGDAARAALAAVDWAAIDALTDEDIAKQVDANPDAAEPSEEGRVYRYHQPTGISTRRIRERLGLSQTAFATRFGFAVGSVRDWEQGRSDPDRATQYLLAVIERNPGLVADVVRTTKAA